MIFKIFLLLIIFITSCGVKGNPKPPPSFIPSAIKDIYVKQYGNKALIYFYYNKVYEDQDPIKEHITFIIYKNEKKVNIPLTSKNNLYWFIDDLNSLENCYKIVVKTEKRESLPSKPVCIIRKNIETVKLNPPKVDIVEEGLKIDIPLDGKEINIYKVNSEEEFYPIPYETSKSGMSIDKNVELNKKYCYYYTLTVDKSVETEKSSTVCETFNDIFPPLPPERGKIIIYDNEATIIWEESKSNDVIGYLIYKNDKLLNPVPIKTYYFIDKNYKPSDVYKIIAVDKASNKSKELTIKNE